MIDLARVTMPLVQLMIEAELSWFQRDLIAQAIQRALTCHGSRLATDANVLGTAPYRTGDLWN